MRLVHRRRRLGVALFAGAVLLAGYGTQAAAVVPDDPDTEPVITDTALFADPSSAPTTLVRGSSSVTVSKTADLARQSVKVSWSGMTPSDGDAGYPVVIMQCRGLDPDREDCWSAFFTDQGDPLGVSSSYTPDQYLPVETAPWVNSPRPNAVKGRTFKMPFRTADGRPRAWELSPGRWQVSGPTEQAPADVPEIVDWSPATQNMRRGRTDGDGKGEMVSWVSTAFENPSLGCSDTKPCSLVVVPIKDRICRTAKFVPPAMAANCLLSSTRSTSAKAPYWPMLGNWYERYVFKLSFVPRTSSCAQRDDAAAFAGSELMAEAARSWAMVRCAEASPVALDYTRKWEPESRRQLAKAVSTAISPSGYEIDAALTNEPASATDPQTAARKLGYAPVGVSGFAIHYNWDRTGGLSVPDVKLSARLVAKLVTQSYSLSYRVGDPGNRPVNPNVPNNPQTLSTDPEFRQLNPDAVAGGWQTSNAQLTIPSSNTDVMLALTRWLWSDPAGRAFLQGKPDPWGMTVNKAYRGWQLPRDDYELKDGWALPAGGPPGSEGSQPQQLAAMTVNSWSEAADDFMIGHPRTQEMRPANEAVPGPPYVAKRSPRQKIGTRALVGLAVTSEVEKAGLRTALLENSAGEFVAPNTQSLHYALDGATVDKSGAWRINHAAMDKRGYPGAMITYAAVPTTTLKDRSPMWYAETLRWIANEGQQYGPQAGQLPDGYLALTEPMKEQTLKVADAVEKQTGNPPVPPKDSDPLPPKDDPTPDDPETPNPDDPDHPDNPDDPADPDPADPDDSGNGTGTGDSGDSGNPGGTGQDDKTTKPGSEPSSQQTPGQQPNGKQQPQSTGETRPVAATKGESLGWLAWGIPAMLLAGVLAGVASPGIRVIAQPGHPVRRGLIAGGSYLRGLVRRGRRRLD